MLAPCRPAWTQPLRADRLRLSAAALLVCSTGVAAAPHFHLLDVWVNGHTTQANVVVVEEGGAFFAPATALAAWRLRPADAPRTIDGAAHHSLQAWQPQLHTQTQRLALSVPADAFTGQVLNLNANAVAQAAAIDRTPLGLALDYALKLDRDQSTTHGSALLDLRAFGLSPMGSLRHSGLLNLGSLLTGEQRWRRLDTAWRQADPAHMGRTTLGDTVSCGGELAPTVRFAGVQMNTDFGLQPDTPPYPMPSVQGSAQVPSGVDLLVNGQLAGSTNVGPGPFILQTLPSLNGAGEIRLVQRDIQGIEQVRTVPYYNSPRLLRGGLSEHCVEAGVLRLDYGLNTDRYQGRFAAAAWREGWSDTVTTSARAASSEAVSSLHLGVHWVPAHLGVVTVQAARSQARDGDSGHGLRMGVERVAPGYHLSANFEHADDGFRQIDGQRPPPRRAALFGGFTSGLTSWSAGGVWQQNLDGSRKQVFTTSVQRRLGPHWQMGLSVLRRERRWQAALMFTRPIGQDAVFAARAQAGDDAGLVVQAQRNEPAAGGAGWRAQAGSGNARAAAAWSWLGDAGRLELQAASAQPSFDPALRATFHGGLIWMGGSPVMGRALGDGVAAQVEVPGMAGVSVQLNRREVAVTDARGRAWVYGLQPWEDNVIGISPEDLPMDMLLGLPELRVRPQAETVVSARFDARRTRSALLVVRHSGGDPIAPGARAWHEQDLAGAGAPFAQGGQVYLSDLQDHNRIRIQGPQGVCVLAFDAPPEAMLQPQLGPFTCVLEAL